MPKVSIIIPVFKAERYLGKCLASLMGQTFEDWECILVDDGSPDGSGAVCDEYAAHDHRLLVIRKENGGVSSARNKGLERASGDYIYFMDSDDYLEPRALERLVCEIEKGYDMVSFNFVREFPDGTVLRHSPFPAGLHTFATHEDRLGFAVSDFMSYRYGWEGWNRLFRRDIILRHHIRYCTESCMGEDMLFCLEYLLYCRSYKVLPDKLYHYIKREGTLLAKGTKGGEQFSVNLAMFAHLRKRWETDFNDRNVSFLPLFLARFVGNAVAGLLADGYSHKQIGQMASSALSDSEKSLLSLFLRTGRQVRSIIGRSLKMELAYNAHLCLSAGSWPKFFPELIRLKAYTALRSAYKIWRHVGT